MQLFKKSLFVFLQSFFHLLFREVNRELRAMIANEEEKRVHLKEIIDKLKTQKNEHSSVIDTLISENDQLSREVLKTERQVRYKCAILIIVQKLFTICHSDQSQQC